MDTAPRVAWAEFFEKVTFSVPNITDPAAITGIAPPSPPAQVSEEGGGTVDFQGRTSNFTVPGIYVDGATVTAGTAADKLCVKFQHGVCSTSNKEGSPMVPSSVFEGKSHGSCRCVDTRVTRDSTLFTHDAVGEIIPGAPVNIRSVEVYSTPQLASGIIGEKSMVHSGYIGELNVQRAGGSIANERRRSPPGQTRHVDVQAAPTPDCHIVRE